MSLKIWIGREYDNTHENIMVSDAIRILRETYTDLAESCHILVNFKIPGDAPKPGQKTYTSEIDLAVLKGKALVIVDLKNYNGPVDFGDTCQWICHAPNGDVEVKGGRDGRTPHGQLCDYRRQMIRLLQTNQFRFLDNRSRAFDYRRFISGMVLFPDCNSDRGDVGSFQNECGRWLSVVRMKDFATKISSACGGRDSQLSENEVVKLIKDVFKLHPVHLVGNVPKLGVEDAPPKTVTVFKTVTIEKPVEVRVEIPAIVRDEFGAIALAYDSDDSNAKKISDLSDIFRRLVARERKRRFRETQIRSLGTAAEILLRDDSDLSRCATHLFRLSAAIHKDRTLNVSKQDVDESFKTLCRVAEKFSGEVMPSELKSRCDQIFYGKWLEWSIASAQQDLKAFFLEVKSVDYDKGTFIGIARDDESREEFEVKLPEPDFGIKPNMVVCAVTPFKEDSVWKASEIVLEPDYLISPQSMGRASIYSNAELYFWLNAIKDDPEDGSRIPGQDGITMNGHILLGNYANACLAEYAARGTNDAMTIARRFCRSNGVDYIRATPNRQWNQECQYESNNIKNLFDNVLPNDHKIRDCDWQIEAPLFSPQFGLSAKADAISYGNKGDSAVVIELKSGKWNNFQGDNPKGEHVCQPSFYSNILGFSRGIRRDNVLPFLYYAKTIPENQYSQRQEGKLFLRPSIGNMAIGGLIRYFSSIRNRIMLLDEKARNGKLREVIENTTIDSFRDAGWNDRFWERKKREIENIINPIRQASELEKLYFYRMLQFVAEESFIARVGDSGSEIGRGGHSMGWRMDVKKRQESGLRLSELERIPQDGDEDALGRIVHLTFNITHNRFNAGCSIRQGDGVGLYQDLPDSNITNSVVFSATVEKLEPDRIMVKLADPQPKALFHFAPTVRFAIESVPMSSMKDYKALWHFLTGDERRRALVLNQTEPGVDEGRQLPIAIDEMERRYSGVSAWLQHAWRAKDWYLLWGPPGTGKTSHAMRALVDEAMAMPNVKIVLLAYTYKATDKICEMLDARIACGLTDSYLRIGNPDKCDPQFRTRIPEEINFKTSQEMKDRIYTTRIFVSTVSTLTPTHSICGIVQHFDIAIIDEASQLLDVHVLPLFCSKRQDEHNGPLVDKFILIGDDRQLPAVVQQSEKTSRIDDKELRNIGMINCRESFFSKLKRIAGDNQNYCGMLNTQFRMHPMIADFCNKYFYDGKLNNGNAPRQLADLPEIPSSATPFERYVLGSRLGFFPVECGHRNGGKVNEEEARICVDIIRALLNGNHRPNNVTVGGAPLRYELKDIGIVVPFRNQIAYVREAIGQAFGNEASNLIVVDTVERNQGGERPVMIFSTVISSVDQADWISAKTYEDDDDGDEKAVSMDKKLNVAITRAQERFYLVGCERVLNRLRAYDDLLEWIDLHNGIYEGN